jgi:radical SAM superfamily enzyme YgiQ (UPF0313 family)
VRFSADVTLARRQIRNPRFLLAFPPQQFTDGELVRPDGTMALPYLAAALEQAGYEADILDMSIGTAGDRLEDTFYRQEPLGGGLARIGMTDERILAEVARYDVIAVTSIFSQQTSRCLALARLIKGAFPDKILIVGGVNARALKEHFFAHGYDAVFLSESERAIVELARFLDRGRPDLDAVSGIAVRSGGGIVRTPVTGIARDLDEYPMPAWEKLPLERYWRIGRIWGGREGWIEAGDEPAYAAVFTSRGCPFRCSYCHISIERGGEAGDIGALRVHSLERVEREFDKLSSLGVRYVLINDDSFLAKKRRVFAILEKLRRRRFRLADVNGVNIVHLFRRSRGRLVVDEPLLAALYEGGFRKISLPFESGSQRLIDKYSSSKWSLADCDVFALIRGLAAAGIAADANFMIGYPDETPDELEATFELARRVMQAGLLGCQFFMVQPFPGSRLFDESLASGSLPPDWHWDELGWSKGSPFDGLLIDKNDLKRAWWSVWRQLNPSQRVGEMTAQLRGDLA